MSAFDVDLFVIGAGSGGVRAARISAGHGAKVMVAEEFRVGGTCVIRGCVPKKLYVQASRFADDFADSAGFGWSLPQQPVFDWTRLVEAKEREITRLSGLYRVNLEKAGVEIVEERAVIEGPNAVRLSKSGRRVTARHILVATGGDAVREPAIPGIEHSVTSNELFDIPSLPDSMLVIGGGYIACEFACVFARLGVKVTQVMRAPNVLRGFDGDLRDGLRDAMIQSGVDLRFGVLPTAVEKKGGRRVVSLSGGASLDVGLVLCATGRRPYTKGLGLDSAGVALASDGAIVVDSLSGTNVPSIHAVGDVTNRINLTPVAIREGHAFADTIFGGRRVEVDHADVASAVFTTPEIGTVGVSEDFARETYDVVDIYRTSFRPMKATLSGRADRVMMKIVVDGQTDRVLGVHVLGDEAGEMAQLLGIAVKMKATKADFDATMAVHPTAAEELVTLRTRTARYERAKA